MKILGFLISAVLKISMFAISISLALIKFTLGIVFMILTLGAFASSTSKY